MTEIHMGWIVMSKDACCKTEKKKVVDSLNAMSCRSLCAVGHETIY